MEDLEKSPSLIGESTFSLFPELPIELKLRVWELYVLPYCIDIYLAIELDNLGIE